MSSGRRQAVERHARTIRDTLAQHREARFVTSDERMKADIIARVRQLLMGDETPIEQNADD